jgi:putative SOS response-associated peptidase YedK
MCGIARTFDTTNPLPDFAPSWNLAPTQPASVVRLHPENQAAAPRRAHLGAWSRTSPINARPETVATSPLFKAAFARRRCLVPAGAFYGWRKTGTGKQPYAVPRPDGQVMALDELTAPCM